VGFDFSEDRDHHGGYGAIEMTTHDNDFLQQIKEAPTDIHLIGYLSQLFTGGEMEVIIAALIRAQELELKQRGLK